LEGVGFCTQLVDESFLEAMAFVQPSVNTRPHEAREKLMGLKQLQPRKDDVESLESGWFLGWTGSFSYRL